MPRWILALAIGLAAGGCRDEGVDALESVRVEVCECRDADCVNAAMAKLTDLPTRQRTKAEGIARAITECAASVYRATDAGTDEEPADGDASGAPAEGSGSGSAGSAGSGSGP